MVLVLTFVLIAVIMTVMAVGLLGGRRLKGSCGGVGTSCECANAERCPLKTRPGH
jgi:hypothetical protein